MLGAFYLRNFAIGLWGSRASLMFFCCLFKYINCFDCIMFRLRVIWLVRHVLKFVLESFFVCVTVV